MIHNKKGALEGTNMLKAILIGLVLFGSVFGMSFFLQQDLGSQSVVNRAPDSNFNNTYAKVRGITSLSDNVSNTLIGQQTSDTNTISLLLSGGYSVLKTIWGYLTLPIAFLQDISNILTIPEIIIWTIIAIFGIVLIFILIKVAFGSSGGNV